MSLEDLFFWPQTVESQAEALTKDRLLNAEPLQQQDCMLYSKIPAEIRTQIFRLALSEFEDKSKPYEPNRVYYRPGCRYQIKQCTELLRTCRLIYQEARTIPVSSTELMYWLFNGPSHNAQAREIAKLLLCMKIKAGQLPAVDTIHKVVQQMCLENCLSFALPMSCRRFKITLRYSDWWCYDSDVDSGEKLGICPWRAMRTTYEGMQAELLEEDLRPWWDEIRQIRRALGDPGIPGNSKIWGYELQFINGLEVFEMEMETDIIKKSQLEAVVDRAKYWRIPLKSGYELRWNGALRESTWKGVAEQMNDPSYASDDEDADDIEGGVDLGSIAPADSSELTGRVEALEMMERAEEVGVPMVEIPMRTYYVVNMVWNVREVPSEQAKVAEGAEPEEHD